MKRMPLTARVAIEQQGSLLRLRSAQAERSLVLRQLYFQLAPFDNYLLDMLADHGGPIPNRCEIRRSFTDGRDELEHALAVNGEGVGLLTQGLRLDRGQFFLAEFVLYAPLPQAYGFAAFVATVPE